MIALYWGLEYTKVLLCYLFILFIWPSVVFRKYLRGKSKILRFSFCAVVPVVLYTTVVLGLGLLHLLNSWVVNILFYGTFLFSLGKSIWPDAAGRKELRRLVTGSLKLRTFVAGLLSDIWFRFKRMCKKTWQEARPHLIEYVLLAAIVAYGVVYFSYAPFVNHSYGFGDMYVHHSWINSMTQGQIFSAGVYPQGMHCVIYLMHTVSGLPVYSCNLFLGCIQVAVLLLSAYCLMREIFSWRGAPLFVLTVFLTAAVKVSAAVDIARLQGTLPGDYGLYTTFLCTLFLLRFLKENIQEGWEKDWRAWLKNENLLMFSLTLAASAAIHFYATVTTFFLCLPFVVLYFRRVFSKTRLLPLAAAILCGVMITVLPMGFGLLSGTPLEDSGSWAINGETSEAILGVQEPAKASNFFVYGYGRLFGDTLGILVMLCSVLMVVCWLLYRFVYLRSHPNAAADAFDSYLPIVVASFIFVVMYVAPYIGLPDVISYSCIASIAYLLLLMVVVVPINVLLDAVHRFSPSWLMQTASAVCVIAICAVTLATGNYHGYFYNELTRYRSVVDVTNSIIQSFPKDTYTIVSTTDDLYQVYEHGRHEELLVFLEAVELGQSYYLPTEYIFVYVEKKPIDYAQNHWSSGPAWLAADTYADQYNALSDSPASKYPEIFASRISDGDAKKEIPEFSRPHDTYKDPEARTIINSKMYKWCQDFAALYDHEMKIYYEDEDFVCYYFRQNTYSLYDLAIWD